MKVQYWLAMSSIKLEEYRSAIAELEQAAQALTGSPLDWQEALDNYKNASRLCETARAALHDAVPFNARNL
jgi:exonuclease VII small subunit